MKLFLRAVFLPLVWGLFSLWSIFAEHPALPIHFARWVLAPLAIAMLVSSLDDAVDAVREKRGRAHPGPQGRSD